MIVATGKPPDVDEGVDDSASTGTLRNWISGCRIAHVKTGSLTKIPEEAVDDFIAAHTVAAVARSYDE
jgi:excisionase family DNA binding protein